MPNATHNQSPEDVTMVWQGCEYTEESQDRKKNTEQKQT